MTRNLLVTALAALLLWGASGCGGENETTGAGATSTTTSSSGAGGEGGGTASASSGAGGEGGAGGAGGAGGGSAESLTACLDRPDVLLRAPSDKLPCELIPPGLTLKP